MALQSETSRIQYNGNNSTTASYAVPFYFFENSHIKAVVTNSSGVDTTLSLGSGFSLTGAGNVTGGALTTTTAVPSSSKVTIFREVPATQTTSYAEGGDFPAASHERALDKLTMLGQQLLRSFGRALRFPETVTGVSPDLPKPEANRVIGWTPAATGLQNFNWATVDGLVSTTNTQGTQIAGLTTRMGAAETDIDNLQTGLANIQTSLANTDDAVDQLNAIVDGANTVSSNLDFPVDLGLITNLDSQKVLQLRKGTEAQHAGFVGAFSEVTVDTTRKTLRVHDGVKAGGYVVGGLPAQGTTLVYLAPRTDNQAGTGSMTDPYDASTATKFREILLNRTKVPAGSTVRLLAGNYQSFLNVGSVRADGTGNYGAGLPNISIIGDGINATKITAVAGNGVGNMFIIAGQCVRFSDMTIDAGWSSLKTAGGISGAVIIWGGQTSIVERIRVINHGGDLTTAAEGFPIMITGSDNFPALPDAPTVTSRNAIIRECIVEQPFVWNSGNDGRGAYYTALSIGGSIYNQINDFRCDGVAIIENNVIMGAIPDDHIHGGLNLDDGSQWRYEIGVTVGGQVKHLIVRNNTFKNLALGCQNDTWHNETAFIEGNHFEQVSTASLTNHAPDGGTATIPNSGAGTPVVITTSSGHGYANLEASNWNNDRNVVKLSTTGTLPAPLNQHTLYFVRYVSPTQMRLSETVNGPFIATTSNGTGTHYINRESMQYLVFRNNVCHVMKSGGSSIVRHDTGTNSQTLIIENNWFGMRNPNDTFVGTNRRLLDLFNTYNVILRDNQIYENIAFGSVNGAFVSVSENNVDQNGLELFLFMFNLPSRTVYAKFSEPKLNGIVLRRAIQQANSASPSGNARTLTNKAVVYVDAGNYELPETQQIGNHIEIIGLADARNIRITAPANSNNGVFQYVSGGVGSTIKNLTLVAPNGGIAFNSPWNVPEANHADIRYENIVFTRPAGGTGKMVNVGVIGMGGGTWVNCESDQPMYDVSNNQGWFFGKMYDCRFPAGIGPQLHPTGAAIPDFYNSTIGGAAWISLNAGSKMVNCNINCSSGIYASNSTFERSTLATPLYLSGTSNKVFNCTIETSATNSINGTATVAIAASQSNKPVAGTITVTQLNSL